MPDLPELPPNGRYILLTLQYHPALTARLGLDSTRDVIVTVTSSRGLQGLRGPVEVIVHESWSRAPLDVQRAVARDLRQIDILYPASDPDRTIRS